jgi:hypothetical protein
MTSQLPIAASAAQSDHRHWTIRKRVGRHIALAVNEDSFLELHNVVLDAATDVLSSPLRMLTLTHLVNAVAIRIDNIPQGTRALIEGTLHEHMIAGNLARLMTLSRSWTTYQLILTSEAMSKVGKSIQSLVVTMQARGSLTISQATELVDPEVRANPKHIELLFGHLLRIGCASPLCPWGEPIDRLAWPHACN